MSTTSEKQSGVLSAINDAASGAPDDRAVAAQLANPHGEMGTRVAEMMNQVNRFITDLVYDAMHLKPADRVLEVGFGNGVLLRDLIAKIPQGKIDGIDISQDMVNTANTLLSDLVSAGKIQLQHGSIEELPYADNSFDHVCSMNTVYFWPNPSVAMREVLRVLKPGGKFTLGLRAGRTMIGGAFDHGFTKYDEPQITKLYTDAGFKNVDLFTRDEKHLAHTAGGLAFENIIIWGEK